MSVSRKARALFAASAVLLGACSNDSSAPSIQTIETAQGNGQTAVVGAALPQALTVKVYDANGNRPLAGKTVTFTVGTGGGTLSTQTATTDANGEATVMYTLGTVAGPQTVSATIEGIGGTVFVENATASSPAAITAEGGNQQVAAAGSALSDPLEVRVVDEFGNPVPNTLVTFTPTSGTVSSTEVMTDESGLATVTYTLGTTKGQQTVVATVNGKTVQFTASAQ